MKLQNFSLALAVLLMAFSADVTFARGGGGGGGGGGRGGGSYRAPSGGTAQQGERAPANNNSGASQAKTNAQGAQSHTTYYHAPTNVDRNNSVLFGQKGIFGNSSAGNNKFNNYGNYSPQPIMGGKVGTDGDRDHWSRRTSRAGRSRGQEPRQRRQGPRQ